MRILRSAIFVTVLATFVIMALLTCEQTVLAVWRWTIGHNAHWASGHFFFAFVSAACAYLVWVEFDQMRRGQHYQAMYHHNGRNLGVPRA